ncbi:MAG: stage II sporulation protein R [Hydrogenoanaerobacterium sp.]
MKKIELAVLAVLIMSVISCSFTSFASACGAVRDETIRLHILANSDTDADQALKLMVRDAVLAEADKAFGKSTTKEEALLNAQAGMGEIISTAEDILRNNGCNDAVRAELTNMFFTTRQYGSVVMPAGRYDAVRVYIGEGKGRNWWCVMFPPMCLPAAKAGASVSEKSPQQLAAEAVLIEAKPEYKAKLAAVELYEKLKEKLHKYKADKN